MMTDSAFEQRAASLRRKAESTALAFGLERMAAEDIAQDVMLRLWAMHYELKDEGRLDALAAMMARRLALNLIRDRRTVSLSEIVRRGESGDEDESRTAEIASTASATDEIEERENELWLEEQLRRLPKTQNIVLRMRQVERRSLKEIAALLGIEETSVSTLLARARRTLMEEIRNRR